MEEIVHKSAAQQLSGVDWKDISKRLLLFSGNFLPYQEKELKKDMVQEAIKKVLTDEQKWYPEKGFTLIEHLKWVLRSVISNHLRKFDNAKRVRKIIDREGETLDLVDVQPSSQKPIDDEIIDKETITRIEKALEKDDEAELVILSLYGGCKSIKEISVATGLEIKQVSNAIRRIRYKASKTNN